VRKKDELGAVPLFLGRRDLALKKRKRQAKKQWSVKIELLVSMNRRRREGKGERTGWSFHLLK
jgi:hypothetical protein